MNLPRFLAVSLAIILLIQAVSAGKRNENNTKLVFRSVADESDPFGFYTQEHHEDNTAMDYRLAGGLNHFPEMLWNHTIHYLPQMPGEGPYVEVFSYNMFQFNYFSIFKGWYVSIEMTFTYNEFGLPAIQVQVVNVDPKSPSIRLIPAKRAIPATSTTPAIPATPATFEKGIQEYDVTWDGAPSFGNLLVANSKFKQQGADETTVVSTYSDKITGKKIGTLAIDTKEAYFEAVYSLMLYYNGQPDTWIAFDSAAQDFDPLLKHVVDITLDDTIARQNDPLALAYGLPEYKVRMYTLPAAEARELSPSRSLFTEEYASNHKHNLAAFKQVGDAKRK